MNVSIWEQQSLLESDYLIVGAGITGLSTAAALLEARPQARVRILERGLLPSGASTKNAGFACLGSLSEVVADIRHYGEDATAQALQLKQRGLRLLRTRLGDDRIGYQPEGGYELVLPKHAAALEQMDALNAWTADVLGAPLFARGELAAWDFPEDQIAALVRLPMEGLIDTGRMMRALLRYVQERGAEVCTGCLVTGYEASEHRVAVQVANPLADAPLIFSAPHVAFCTNGFVHRLFPDVPVAPGRGQVLLTKPLPRLPFRGAFHFDEGYFYFRDVGDRVLFGGGRNLFRDAETTDQFGATEAVQQVLEAYLHALILPGQPVEVERRWSGVMGFQRDRLLPLVEQRGPRVVLGVGMNGMGIAAGSEVGRQVAQVLLGDHAAMPTKPSLSH
ncbi:MAG: FAD-dependent oxidoreductase [Bacteroidota bacterium]